MRTYDCFGSYDPNNEYANIEISIPKNKYIYRLFNISSADNDGLVICFKTSQNPNVVLNNPALYFQKEYFKLTGPDVVTLNGHNFSFTKPIFVITFHDDEMESRYESHADEWIDILERYNSSSDWEENLPKELIPAKSGFGGLKRI